MIMVRALGIPLAFTTITTIAASGLAGCGDGETQTPSGGAGGAGGDASASSTGGSTTSSGTGAGGSGGGGGGSSDAIPGGGEILFQEPFEDTDFEARGWYDGPSGALSAVEHVASGKSSFVCAFAAGASSCRGG